MPPVKKKSLIFQLISKCKYKIGPDYVLVETSAFELNKFIDETYPANECDDHDILTSVKEGLSNNFVHQVMIVDLPEISVIDDNPDFFLYPDDEYSSVWTTVRNAVMVNCINTLLIDCIISKSVNS